MARVDTDDDLNSGAVDATEVEVSDTENTESTENTENVNEDSSTTENVEGGEAGEAQSTEAAAPAEPTGPSDEEIKVLVDSFTAETEGVVTDSNGGRDESTGQLSVELVSKVKTRFGALPAGKARKAAKDYLQEKMKSCMDQALASGDMDAALFAKARSYLQLHEEATSAAKTTTATVARPQLSPTELLLQRALPLYLSLSAIEVPEGVEADWETKLQSQAAELQPQVATFYQYLAEVAKLPEDAENKPEEPSVADTVKQAFRIARGRAVGAVSKRAAGTKTGGGPRPAGSPRGDVGRHILNAFADKASGTFLTVAEIVNAVSTDAGYAPGDKPSPGAVAARLFKDGAPHTTLAGIVPGYENPADTGSKKGARKA